MDADPLYPFGYGLSYSSFRFDSLSLSAPSIPAGRELDVKVRVTNTGNREADEVAQLYLSDLEASARVPRWQLCGFRRVTLKPGESQAVSFTITPRQMSVIGDDGSRFLEPGKFRLWAGGSQPDDRSRQLTGTRPVTLEFTVTGAVQKMPLLGGTVICRPDKRLLDALDDLRGELRQDVQRLHVLLHLLRPARTGDHRAHVRIVRAPGQRELRDGRPELRSRWAGASSPRPRAWRRRRCGRSGGHAALQRVRLAALRTRTAPGGSPWGCRSCTCL